jgi:hypothetical protein
MKYKIFLLIIIGLIVIRCSASLYIPENKEPAIQEQLLKGRKLYVEHCSSCHNLYFPKQFSKEHWLNALDEMQKKANISNEEKKNIILYLTSQP